MAENGNHCGSFLRGFLIGSFFGALAGLLFAPKSGKELRSELKEKGEQAFDDAKQLYSEAWGKAKVVLEEARLKAREVLNDAEEKAYGIIKEAKKEVGRMKDAMQAGMEATEQESSEKEDKTES